MTTIARTEYEKERSRQHERNEARHIRTKVNEARQNSHTARMRWPFELLQNALDAGPRSGRGSVAVVITHEPHRVVFEHDGTPFTMKDLAALLSGGSSKEFDSDETTGRFGTGFLVTHVLSEHASVEGLVSVSSGYEVFALNLDRGGDEDAILANIERCDVSIGEARPISDPDSVPSARFAYPVDDDDTFGDGIRALRSALPYLYGTRPTLGEVRLVLDDSSWETWSPGPVSSTELSGGYLEERHLRVTRNDLTTEYRILRVKTDAISMNAALVLLETIDGEWVVRVPNESDPRIYVRYPLRDSHFLPVNFIFDGDFEPDQERSRMLMGVSDKVGLKDAFAAAVLATSYASETGLRNYQVLAHADAPANGFDSTNEDEQRWWRAALSAFASSLAVLPIVETTVGKLPALGADGERADFIVARLLDGAGPDETSVARMWRLVSDVTGLFPPAVEVANDWCTTATGWDALDVELNRITVERLAEFVRKDAKTTEQLRLSGDPYEWLAGFIDVIGECWSRRQGVEPSVLRRLVPNQNGSLCSPDDLRRDVEVPEALKDICRSVGLDVRRGLLSTRLADHAKPLPYASDALAQAIPRTVGPGEIFKELLDFLRSMLPEDTECSTANESAWRGTSLLLEYLWRTQREAGATLAQQIPLVNSTKNVVHWSSDRMMMAPVSSWNERARPFHEAYPPDRVLHEVYLDATGSIVEALVIWGIAYADPITKSSPRELDGQRLAEMAEDGVETVGVTVRGESFSQIALLPTVVINHVKSEIQARALIGLVLCHVAPSDSSWREIRFVQGWKDRTSLSVPLRPALWLGDLKSRDWVPRVENGKPARFVATVDTLKPLLDPQWLHQNGDAIALLTECFGFDELDLRLLGIPDEEKDRVRHGLARLLETGGSDPEFYESLAADVEARKRRARDVGRWRRIGLAIQEAVGHALESQGLSIELIDRGFDFEVALPVADDTLGDLGLSFEVGTYFVEVKSTTAGPMRLTPLQAETAAGRPSRYVLCVVDLREVTEERLDQPWERADVEPLAVMLSSIGDRVDGTYELVREARDSDVGIRNEAALRYEVPVQMWAVGSSISRWVETVAADLKTEISPD